jgi:hypothetical protein
MNSLFGGGKKQEAIDIISVPFLEVSFKLDGKKINMLNGEGIYLPDVPSTDKNTKEKKKKAPIPAANPDERKMQQAKSEIQKLKADCDAQTKEIER